MNLIRDIRFARKLEGPMTIITAALFDPSLKQFDLFLVEWFLGFRWRHSIGVVVRLNSTQQFLNQDIVIKALGHSLSEVRGFAGATELGDQNVGLVLDAASIVEEMLTVGETLRKAALSV